MAVKLPYDMEEEILSRVPWKSLVKLRCVCKLWNSLILEERLNKKNLSFHMPSYSGEHRFILTDRGPKISAVGIEEEQSNMVDPPSLIVQDFNPYKSPTMRSNQLVQGCSLRRFVVVCHGQPASSLEPVAERNELDQMRQRLAPS